MSNFETLFLPHVRLWSKILTTQQIFMWNWFWKRKFSWTICFQMVFQNLSEFKPTLSNSSVYASELLQRVSFRIKLLSICRFLLWLSALPEDFSQDFYNASDFDEKIVVRNLKLLEKLLPKKIFIQKRKIGSNFLIIIGFWIIFFKRVKFWTNFSNASDLEPFSLQLDNFELKF